ncbi:DUF262 domain-containing protein [Herbaspirillum frisingense]|uniref:DUF262 domain-containing protein n=1 Tax=Herbaspirillum frisingense TaxID=92645 RepID=UPI0039AF0117
MFKVSLRPPQSLKSWYEEYLSNRMDMDPPYQRKAAIWSTWKRAHLIDSILNDFDIPKFYVALSIGSLKTPTNRSQKEFAVIDGKQRFQAIFDFFNNEIKLNKSFVLEEEPSLPLAGLTYAELKNQYPFYAYKIENYLPAVMDVVTDEPHKIDELFVRLNSGEAANSTEKRNAKQGPISSTVRDLVLHPFFQKNIAFATKRMQEFSLATKLYMLEFKGQFVDTKARNMDDFADSAKLWAESFPHLVGTVNDPYAVARDNVYAVLDLLSAEFNENDPLLSSAGNIPLYYWFARENPKATNELRDFVYEFTTELKENLKASREDPDSADAELSLYYTMARTTNDQASLEGRYKIFLKRFKTFRKPLPATRRR